MTSSRYEKYIVRKPAYPAVPRAEKSRVPLTYMSRKLVPGCNVSVELGWVRAPGARVAERTYDYDAVVLYIGGDPASPEELGGVFECRLGGQPLTIDTTSALYVPKGVKHGPITWKKFIRPHLEVSLVLGPEGTGRPAARGDVDYEKYLVRHPRYLQNTDVTDALQGPAGIYVSSDLIPGAKAYIDFGWIGGIPRPNPPIPDHSHDYAEVVLNIGGDPAHPEDLGAEIEFCIDGEPLTFDTTAAVYAPKGIKHGPLTWKRLDRPHLLMPIVIGTGSLAQAAPAGYKEK